MSVSIKISAVTKLFGAVKALDDVNLVINPGELFFLLGPSGCGKTTLLRTIAGFNQPDSGTIEIGGADVTTMPPHKRDTGMVFQSYALWPHLSVFENVAFGLKVRKCSRQEIERRVARALELVQMSDRSAAKPNQLSGGQQQRVALARALVVEPQCLLLDEPLSNLDAKLRTEMRGEIRKICKAAGLTAVYVTHDQKEALAVADRLAVLRAGRIEQVGAPNEVYRHPENRFVASFIGEANFIPDGERVLCVRPESVIINPRLSTSGGLDFTGIIRSAVYLGEVTQYSVEIEGAAAPLAVTELGSLTRVPLAVGENVRCHIPADQITALDK